MGNTVGNDVYERLADAMDRLPNAYPRTASGVEVEILKRIFTPEEAQLVLHLHGEMEPLEIITKRAGLAIEDVESNYFDLAKRGLVWFRQRSEKPHFRMAPFVVGIYEASLENMDHDFAHLIEQYFREGGVAGIMKPQPAIHRVVPAYQSVKSEWILPYDDIRAIMMAMKTFRVRDCICRAQQDHIGRRCDFPVKMCLSFSPIEQPTSSNEDGLDSQITQKEALAILDTTEEIGLVHTVSNVAKGIYYVCNCCGCCCGVLRGITDFGIANSVAHANYFAVIDPDECVGCKTCLDRCHVNAITEQDDISVVDETLCIGCGLCVTGCPNEVAKLQRKPDEEIVEPPIDRTTWERERLRGRGLNK